jgi:NTP pyrophosphatase (non-canonical NTP hydrolase)
MSYHEDSIDWQTIRLVDEWLDGAVADEYKDQPLAQDWARLSKVSEELGEATQAFIGYTGQNPRKGVTNGLNEVLEELADVVMTGLLAMQHFTKQDAAVRELLRAKQRKLYNRVPKES